MRETENQRRIAARKPRGREPSNSARPIAGQIILTSENVAHALSKSGFPYPVVSEKEARQLTAHFDSFRRGQIELVRGGNYQLTQTYVRLTKAVDKAIQVITKHTQSHSKPYSGHYGSAFLHFSERLANRLIPDAIAADSLLKSTHPRLTQRDLNRLKRDPAELIRMSANNLIWLRNLTSRAATRLNDDLFPFGPKMPLQNVLVARLLSYWQWKRAQSGQFSADNGQLRRGDAAKFIRHVVGICAGKVEALRQDGVWDAADLHRELERLRSAEDTNLETLISNLRRRGSRPAKELARLLADAEGTYAL